ncbi:hypothetical protein GALL_357680 [mine drainage metagenome]|uniref:Uncharacterized protein n=1 Tax=mine drainage metagenome TaxID=410659 RepID=A0A1J5QFY8_9ZZZZ
MARIRRVSHLGDGTDARQRVADVVRQHRHQRALRRLFLAAYQRFPAACEVRGHLVDCLCQRAQFCGAGLGDFVVQPACAELRSGVQDGGYGPDDGALQKNARKEQQQDCKDHRNAQPKQRGTLCRFQPVFQVVPFQGQQALGMCGNGFIAAEHAGFDAGVEGLFQRIVGLSLVAVQDAAGFGQKFAIALLQFFDGILLFLAIGQLAQLLEMLSDLERVAVIFHPGLRIGQKIGVEQLLHLSIEVATGLLDFLNQRVDALRFLRGLLPLAYAKRAGGDGQYQQQHEGQFVDQEQLIEGAGLAHGR